MRINIGQQSLLASPRHILCSRRSSFSHHCSGTCSPSSIGLCVPERRTGRAEGSTVRCPGHMRRGLQAERLRRILIPAGIPTDSMFLLSRWCTAPQCLILHSVQRHVGHPVLSTVRRKAEPYRLCLGIRVMECPQALASQVFRCLNFNITRKESPVLKRRRR